VALSPPWIRVGTGSDQWLRGGRRLCCLDNLPMLRVFLHGPRWRARFGVRKSHGTWGPLIVTLEDDVRERVCEELRPGVCAQWSDPRERLAYTQKRPARHT
jgi:hypothetical protein